MIRGVVLLFFAFGVVEETKGEPSTLQATIQDGYYLGSGEGQFKDYDHHQHQERTLSGEEMKVVQDVFSPDYYEPNIILDYRYMKSGGRGYARSDGGQVLILPKRRHMLSSYNDYDSLIEHLRLKHQQEMNKYWRYESEHDGQEHQQQQHKYKAPLHDELTLKKRESKE